MQVVDLSFVYLKIVTMSHCGRLAPWFLSIFFFA